MLEKIFNMLWNSINPQKYLDKHYDKLTKANISRRVREQLYTDLTKATISYGKWTLVIYILVLIFAGIYVLLSLWIRL